MKCLLALALLFLLVGCTSASQDARRAQFRDRMAAWDLPHYPTTVPVVDGRVLHPSTRKLVNCALMAPFEGRLEDYRNLGVFYPWAWETTAEVGGWTAFLPMGGLHEGQIRQGIAMSRACRGITVPAPPPSPRDERLRELDALKADGALTDEEYRALRRRALEARP